MIGQTLGHYRVTAAAGPRAAWARCTAPPTRDCRATSRSRVLPAERSASDAERLARFRREAQVLAALNHANVGAIYGLE